MVDPWSYALKTNKEHAEQVALFIWAAIGDVYPFTHMLFNETSIIESEEGFRRLRISKRS